MYTLLDLISDIGGIQSLLFSAFAFLVSVWNYNMFDNYMVSRLYKLERGEIELDSHNIRDDEMK